MAGGMGRSQRETLAQRSANTQAAAEPRPPVDAAPVDPGPAVRHCWVTGPGARHPGLLLGWQRRADGWYGRVVHPVREADGWIVVEEWVSAGLLEPLAAG